MTARSQQRGAVRRWRGAAWLVGAACALAAAPTMAHGHDHGGGHDHSGGHDGHHDGHHHGHHDGHHGDHGAAKGCACKGKAAVGAPGEVTATGGYAAHDAGLHAPGYHRYEPAMLALRHGELAVRPVLRLDFRGGILAGGDNQQQRGDYLERPGFALARSRIGAQGQLADHVPFALVSELSAVGPGSGGPVLDGWIGYERFRFAKMYFGVRTVPFAYSAILSSADAGLAERSRAADAMAPFRQVGITLGGDYALAGLSWRAGVYNGFDRKVNFWRGVEGASGMSGNRFHGLSFVGRLQAQPLGAVGPTVADLDGGGLRLSLGGGGYANDGGAAWMTAMSTDVHVKFAGAHLLLEWIADSAEPAQQSTTGTSLPAALRRQAMSAELGYTAGKLGIAARAEVIDPNRDVESNDDELWLSCALSWHFIRNMLRADLQYDHRRERAGQPLDNDSLNAKLLLRY